MENLKRDVEAHTVPQGDWDKYIMGEATRFDLVPFRRGLYGGETIGSVVGYGDTLLLKGAQPWFMAIQIKEECRQDQSVYSDSFVKLYDSEHFRSWLKTHPSPQMPNLSSVLDRCFPIATSVGPDFRDAKFNFIDGRETPCDQLANRFLTEENIKVVSDDAWADSWYVRDRNCIEDIRGTPSDILRIMATDRTIWNPSSLGQKLAEDEDEHMTPLGEGYKYILLKALLDQDGGSTDVARAIRHNLETTPGSLPLYSFERQSLQALQSCVHRHKAEVFFLKIRDFLARMSKLSYDPKVFAAKERSFARELLLNCN